MRKRERAREKERYAYFNEWLNLYFLFHWIVISVLNWLVSESVTCDVRDKCSLIEIYIHRVCSVDATGIQSVRTPSFSNVAILRNCSIDLRSESMRMNKKKKENDSKKNLGTNEFTLFSAEWLVEFDDEYVRFHLSSVIGKLKERKKMVIEHGKI